MKFVSTRYSFVSAFSEWRMEIARWSILRHLLPARQWKHPLKEPFQTLVFGPDGGSQGDPSGQHWRITSNRTGYDTDQRAAMPLPGADGYRYGAVLSDSSWLQTTCQRTVSNGSHDTREVKGMVWSVAWSWWLIISLGWVSRRGINTYAWVWCSTTRKHAVVDHSCHVQLAKLFRRSTINPALKSSIIIMEGQ